MAVAGIVESLMVAVPATATAQDPIGGCKENGQAVAGNAQGLRPFGEIVRTFAPINDDHQAFLLQFCGHEQSTRPAAEAPTGIKPVYTAFQAPSGCPWLHPRAFRFAQLC